MSDGIRSRGQSEALGFVLVFGVVILAIALVGTVGFAGLDGVQDFQRTSAAERALLTVAGDVDDVVGGAPGRSTEVGITDASLSLETAETTVEITAPDGTTNTTTVTTHPIVYDSGTGTTVTYRGGAVVRRDDGSPVLLRSPGFVVEDGVLVLPIVETSPAGTQRIGGTASVSVETRPAGTDLLATGDAVDTVTLNISSPNADAWERYFERVAADAPVTVTRTGDDVEVTIDVDRAYVTVHRVDVVFQRG